VVYHLYFFLKFFCILHHQAGRTYGKKGKTPAVKISAKKFKANAISALNNKGRLLFSVFNGKFNSKLFLKFLKRLIKYKKGKKVFLIVDNLSVHKSAEIQKFVNENKSKIELFYLPTYSPELNPDELLNQDLKANIFKTKRSQNKTELNSMLRAELRKIQRNSEKITNYFKAENVKYAA